MIPAGVAACGAAVLGPLTLLVANRTMRSSWSPTRTEVVSVTALAGLTVLLAADWAWAAPAALPLAVGGPAAAVVDAREGRLPDLLTLPLIAGTAVITVLSEPGAARSLIVAGTIAIGAVTLGLVASEVLGWGDVKLLPTVALVLGGQDALPAGLLTIIVLLALSALLVWVVDRRALVPFGPALVFGTLLSVHI